MRSQPAFQVDLPASKQASAWVSALLQDWISHLRSCVGSAPSFNTPGRRLAEYVGVYVQDVVRRRRQALHGSAEFKHRRRDPSAAELEADDAVDSITVARKPKKKRQKQAEPKQKKRQKKNVAAAFAAAASAAAAAQVQAQVAVAPVAAAAAAESSSPSAAGC